MFFLPMIDNLPLHHGHGRCYSMSKVNLVFHIHLNVVNIFIGEMLFFICMNISFYWRNQPCIYIYIQRNAITSQYSCGFHAVWICFCNICCFHLPVIWSFFQTFPVLLFFLITIKKSRVSKMDLCKMISCFDIIGTPTQDMFCLCCSS